MKKILIGIIKFYRRYLSGLKKPCCRFYPTCSEYAMVSIERFGAARGSILAAGRIIRCNPLCKGGFDPVPEKVGGIVQKRRDNDTGSRCT